MSTTNKKTPGDGHLAERYPDKETFIETFFKKGAELTSELLTEVDELREKVASLVHQNEEYKLKLASDDAIRDLLKTIENLEEEKSNLNEQANTRHKENLNYIGRYREMEKELDTMASLYVASYQLHATLEPSEVLSVIEQMLMQFIGASSFVIYLKQSRDSKDVLVPIHAFHCENVSGQVIQWDDEGPIIEAAKNKKNYISDVSREREGNEPLACIPIMLGDTVIGVISILDLLEQKNQFVDVDFELFKLLALHSASAIIGAGLLSQAKGIDAGVKAYEPI